MIPGAVASADARVRTRVPAPGVIGFPFHPQGLLQQPQAAAAPQVVGVYASRPGGPLGAAIEFAITVAVITCP
jgi:hypothetical protein